MDLQIIINILIGVVMTGLGWFSKEMWTAVKGLQKDIAHLREEIPKVYVSKDAFKEFKDDFREFIAEIKQMLVRIDTKLDTKEDK